VDSSLGMQVRVKSLSDGHGPLPGRSAMAHELPIQSRGAQRAINEQAGEGHLYLGEWHTDPEDHPNAWGTDFDAMTKLQRASSTRLTNLLMVMQRRASWERGLALHSFGVDGLTRWQEG
jgi:hypothetical protein